MKFDKVSRLMSTDNEKLSDLAAERAVLSGIYQYGEDAYLDVADFVQPDTFHDTTNQVIFKALAYLYEKKGVKHFDQSSFMAAVKDLDCDWVLEQPADLNHIKSIFNGRVRLENVRTWGSQIRKLQIARLLRNQLGDAANTVNNIRGTEGIDEILGIAEGAIFDFTSLLQTNENNEPELLWKGVDDYLNELEDNPVDIVGLSSGMTYYDQSIGGGFRRQTVSLIGARPKTGKSMLAANIGLHVSKTNQIPVLYLDTEMVKRDHWSRMLPNIAYSLGVKVTINEVETGQYSKNNFKQQKVREAAEELKKAHFYYLNVSGKPFEEILSIMRRWITKVVGFDENGRRKDCLIIYDYLKMMNAEGINESLKEYQVLGFMMTSLHNFAVRQDVPILSFIQLNRDGIDGESTDVISGSDRILWLVTNFSIYKVKSPEEIADCGPEHGSRKLVPISTRHGEGLAQGDYINVLFDGKYGRITEGETKLAIKAKAAGPQAGAPAQDVENIPFKGDDPNDELQSDTNQPN